MREFHEKNKNTFILLALLPFLAVAHIVNRAAL